MLSDGEPRERTRRSVRGLEPARRRRRAPTARSTDWRPLSARRPPIPKRVSSSSAPAGTGKTRVRARHGFAGWWRRGATPSASGCSSPPRPAPRPLRARIETRLRRGYDELYVLTPAQLAGLVLRAAGAGADPFESVLTPGDRLAMLVERIDELSLRHHDFGGRPNTLLGGFVRRIDRLKAELVGADAYVAWAQALADDAPDARAGARVRPDLLHPRADAGRGGRPRRRRPDRLRP